MAMPAHLSHIMNSQTLYDARSDQGTPVSPLRTLQRKNFDVSCSRCARKDSYRNSSLVSATSARGHDYPGVYLALVQNFQREVGVWMQRIFKVNRQDDINSRDIVGLFGVVKNRIKNALYIVKQRPDGIACTGPEPPSRFDSGHQQRILLGFDR